MMRNDFKIRRNKAGFHSFLEAAGRPPGISVVMDENFGIFYAAGGGLARVYRVRVFCERASAAWPVKKCTHVPFTG